MFIYKVELHYYVVKDNEIVDQTTVNLGYFRTKETARYRLMSEVHALFNQWTSGTNKPNHIDTEDLEDDSIMLVFGMYSEFDEFGEWCEPIARSYIIRIEEIELAD